MPTLIRTITAGVLGLVCLAASDSPAQPERIKLQPHRWDGGVDVTELKLIDPHETALVICDMWDKHWCKSATARVAELAPHINDLASALRAKGVLIIHCPSDTMDYYRDFPGRKLA